MSKLSNHKILRISLIILLTLVLGIFITVIVYYNYYLLDYREINISVNVVEGVGGFNVDNTTLDFSKIPRGSSGVRYFSISTKNPVLVKTSTIGSIAPFVTYSEQEFIMLQGESKQITTEVIIPEETQPGIYDGKVRIFFYRK